MGLMLSVCDTHAQTLLNSFVAIAHDQGVDLHWEIKAGSTCNGILIQRSTDSVNFQTIGQIDGVCGSATAAQPYSYSDATPVSFHFNYYRLLFNGTEPSVYVNAYYYHVNTAFEVHPHPITSESRIFLSGDVRTEYVFKWYDASGRLLHTWQPLSSISDFPYDKIPAGHPFTWLVLYRENTVLGSKKLLRSQ